MNLSDASVFDFSDLNLKSGQVYPISFVDVFKMLNVNEYGINKNSKLKLKIVIFRIISIGFIILLFSTGRGLISIVF